LIGHLPGWDRDRILPPGVSTFEEFIMRFYNPALLLAGLSAMLSAPGAFAADVPMRKSGLWGIRTETAAGDQKMPGPRTMQMCVEKARGVGLDWLSRIPEVSGQT